MQRRKTTGREKMQNFNPGNFYPQYSQPHFFYNAVPQTHIAVSAPKIVMEREAVNDEKEKTKRERWVAKQTEVLVAQWVKHFDNIESSRCNQYWPKIVQEVNSHGPEKTLKQCKVKIRNLKDSYKKCKDENKSSGNNFNTCQFYDEFDRVLSTRNVVNLPEFREVGAVKPLAFDDEKKSEEDKTEPLDAGSSKKRKTTEPENLDDSFEYYEELKRDFADAKKKKTDDKKGKQTFQQELIQLQKQQMKSFEESERRFQEFQKSLLDKQLEAEAKEKDKDRAFFLEFAKIVSSNK